MRAILFGSVPLRSKQIQALKKRVRILESDLKIGVDGGFQLGRRFGVEPDFFVGDQDSIPIRIRRDVIAQKCLVLSTEKDRSDLYYATLSALMAGATRLTYIAVTGGPRMDHHMATMLDLVQVAQGRFGKVKSIEAHGPEGSYYFLSDEMPAWRAKLSLGQLVSVFAMTPRVTGVHLQGFKFPLKNSTLEPHSLGLSNQVRCRRCEIRIKKGVLLVVVPSLE